MSDVNDLIRRLREFIPPAGVPREITDYEVTLDEAAALIEQQAARIAELEGELRHFRSPDMQPSQRYWEGRWRDEEKRAEQAERDLEELQKYCFAAAHDYTGLVELFRSAELEWKDSVAHGAFFKTIKEFAETAKFMAMAAELKADPKMYQDALLSARRDKEQAERELAAVRERLALSAKSLLLGKMEEISEDLWCAGWLIGLEFSLWRAVTDGPFDYGLGRISQEDCDLLKSLSDDAGGWWRLDINSGRTFTPMNEWLQLVRSPAQKDGDNE